MPPDVVGVAEVADLLGLNRSRVYALLRADMAFVGTARRRAAFPAGTKLACGEVWDRLEVLAWHHDRAGTTLNLLRAWRASDRNITDAARLMDLPRTTARDRLAAIGAL